MPGSKILVEKVHNPGGRVEITDRETKETNFGAGDDGCQRTATGGKSVRVGRGL
ncbi:hypothetical protein ABI_44200 [Asticcacaulis biprosthecium C19]|uniref:Uncharacterized protein n=1 Tax=Asticcacaulis biprosthecium C19 TaxID=715226 RepID=F4QTC3_9CAUL|nr:hypothetical protein ABI_44200 [Asticcacaulis biprosthecium C19]